MLNIKKSNLNGLSKASFVALASVFSNACAKPPTPSYRANSEKVEPTAPIAEVFPSASQEAQTGLPVFLKLFGEALLAEGLSTEATDVLIAKIAAGLETQNQYSPLETLEQFDDFLSVVLSNLQNDRAENFRMSKGLSALLSSLEKSGFAEALFATEEGQLNATSVLMKSLERNNFQNGDFKSALINVPNEKIERAKQIIDSKGHPDLGHFKLSAGQIRNGVTVDGVAGLYPSSEFPLDGATETADLSTDNFYEALKNDSNKHEFFDSAGNKATLQGSSQLNPANVKPGVSVLGVVGDEQFGVSFAKKRTITVTNPSSSSRSNSVVFKVFSTINWVDSGHVRDDGSDIRITDSSGNDVPFFINGLGTRLTHLWLSPAVLTSGSNTFSLRYGNPKVTKSKQSTEFFNFTEDFESFTISNNSKWENEEKAKLIDGHSGYGIEMSGVTGSIVHNLGTPISGSYAFALRVKSNVLSDFTWPFYPTAQINGTSTQIYSTVRNGESWHYKIGGTYAAYSVDEQIPKHEWQSLRKFVDVSTGLGHAEVNNSALGSAREEAVGPVSDLYGSFAGDQLLRFSMTTNSPATNTHYDDVYVWKPTFPRPSVVIGAEEQP